MVIAIFWIILCFVAGAVGEKRKIGFGGAFFLSFFLSPLVGLLIAFNSDKKVALTQASPAMLKLITDGDKLAINNQKDEAIVKYNSALTYSSKAPNTHFKLAKLYSLKEDCENSLRHLSAAIRYGYNDFEKINHDKDLNYLRREEAFKTFVANGYKIQSTQTASVKPLSRIEELEKLNGLYEKGVLTKEEFENEKKKILSTSN